MLVCCARRGSGFRRLALMATAALLGGIGLSQARAATNDSAQKAFHDLYEQEWTWRMDLQGSLLDGKPSAHLPKEDPDTQQVRLETWTRTLEKLNAIPVQQLSAQDQVNYAVYKQQLMVLLEDQKLRVWEIPFDADSGFWSDLPPSDVSFLAEKDYRDYISRLQETGRYFADEIAAMKAGLARGFVQPRLIVEQRLHDLEKMASVTTEKSAFAPPFQHFPDGISPKTQDTLRKDGLAAIRDTVIPAYKTLYAFMKDDYLPHARASLGAEDQPDGAAYYRSQIREYTTLDMSPDEIHKIGLKEVADLHRQMLDIIAETHFKGDFPAFLKFLRTDSQFYPKTGDELLKDAAWLAKRVDGKVGDFIGRLPRGRFTIEPVPADVAPVYTAGRGGPHVYLVNTYDLPSRPLYALPALTLHESSPGHSLQLSLAEEQPEVPPYRRFNYISAYGEGWALYCEYLGNEMGIYETAYDRFGYLSYQAWRAARLVVDTGLHHFHWSREQAREYLRENTALSEHEIDTEVDRYIAWPAQALSYYLGEADIRRNRARAQKALGKAFDIRAFHDAVLATGSVPLPVLDAAVDRFIQSGGRSPYAVTLGKQAR